MQSQPVKSNGVAEQRGTAANLEPICRDSKRVDLEKGIAELFKAAGFVEVRELFQLRRLAAIPIRGLERFLFPGLLSITRSSKYAHQNNEIGNVEVHGSRGKGLEVPIGVRWALTRRKGVRERVEAGQL